MNNFKENEIIKEKNKKVTTYFSNKKEIKNSDTRGILFSKLPTQQLNPDRYDNLMTFWNNSLIEVCKSYNILIFTPKLLSTCFTVENVSPIYLPLILNEMIKTNFIIKYEDYIKQIGWSRWIWNKVIVQPFQYYTGTSNGILGDNEKNIKFVVREIVDSKAEQLYQLQIGRMSSTTDNIVSYVNLEKSIKDWNITKEELDLLLSTLVKQSKALIMVLDKEKKGVKFAFEGEQVLPIADTDFGILKLQSTYETLKQQENKLLEDIQEVTSNIKRSVSLKQKSHALIQLKKKKLLESILEKRATASNNIHEILFSIESAKSNQQIMDSLCSGVSTLKQVNSQISVDQVDSILDDYQETVANQREIDDAMKSGFNNIETISSLDIDDVEQLEKELDQMEKDHLLKEKLDKQQKERDTITTTTSTNSKLNTNLPIPENKNEEDELLRELELLTVSSNNLNSNNNTKNTNKIINEQLTN